MNRFAPTLVALSFLLASCTEDGDEEFRFQIENTGLAVAQSTPGSPNVPKLLIRERFLVFLASESDAGANLNAGTGDGDTNDNVVVVVNMVSENQTVLGVAARDFVFLGTNLYLEVDEFEDSKDWDTDGVADDVVLLHVSAGGASNANLQFVATLRTDPLYSTGVNDPGHLPGPHFLVSDNDRLFFVHAASAVPGASESTLSMIALSSGALTTPVRLQKAGAAAQLHPVLLGHEANVVFAALDERIDGNQNGDTDSTDELVLAVLDAAEATPDVNIVVDGSSNGFALASQATPLRALDAGSKRVVAFLVDELGQDAGSLNDSAAAPSLFPTFCNVSDVDESDEVLHVLTVDDTTHVVSTATNLFLAGVGRILLTKNGANTFVATLVPESDEDNCPNGLNPGDSDRTDFVLRWLRADPTGGSVFVDPAGFVALRSTLPGGVRGATDLDGRWIVVVDEAADSANHDGQAADNLLVAWLDPSDGLSAEWEFDHDGASNGIQAVGASWMAEMASRQRLLMGFEESVANLAINGRDNDKLDAIPVFARFDPDDEDDLDFPGPGVASHDNRVGTVIANGLAFFRVDESDDNFDWNEDGDDDDEVLFRVDVATLENGFFLRTLNAFDMPAVVLDDGSNIGAAFVVEEVMAGDINDDNDDDDFIVQWMRVGP